MEPFELIRARATALHDEVTAAGTDPFDPPALVRAAARLRDLTIHLYRRANLRSKGAGAPRPGTIICRRGATPAAAAELVAHETGHSGATQERPTAAHRCGPLFAMHCAVAPPKPAALTSRPPLKRLPSYESMVVSWRIPG